MKDNSVTLLNRKLFDLLDSFPRATWELLDFHYKTYFEKYVNTIENTKGRTLFVFVENIDDIVAYSRRLLLIADNIVFNINQDQDNPDLSIFPIPDEFKSPVLGINPVLDPITNKLQVPPPALVAEMITTFAKIYSEGKINDSIFGYNWSNPDGSWQRSTFTRTSQSYKNDKGQDCHIAVGLGYRYDDSIYNWLLKDARPLLLSGHFTFAPFIHLNPDSGLLNEQIQKARLLKSILTIRDKELRYSSGNTHFMTNLEVPFLENISLNLLSKVLQDEGESLNAFRRKVDRAIEDVLKKSNSSDFEKEMEYLKREFIDDELQRVRTVCQKITRMKVMSAANVIMINVVVTIAGLMGANFPEILLSTPAYTPFLSKLYEAYEEELNIKDSPMYFLWKLGNDIK
ncbi:MAG: hypothetical protein HQK96_00910 [Nitrospirae bacterium]|nr:hypothetical protein [Nitrospirota bacterium]